MPRSFRLVGLFALALTPGLVLAQAAAPETHTVHEGDTSGISPSTIVAIRSCGPTSIA